MKTANRIVGVVFSLALAAAPTWAQGIKIGKVMQPGKSVGSLKLGGTVQSVHRALGKPAKSFHLPNGMTEDCWYLDVDTGAPGMDVLYQAGHVAQFETSLPWLDTAGGDSVKTSLLNLLKKHGTLQASAYAWPKEGVKYYYDDLHSGIAFALGTSDPSGLVHDMLDKFTTANVQPDSIVIHPANKPPIVATGTAHIKPAQVSPIMAPAHLYQLIHAKGL